MIESLAAGTPVIALRRGSVPEILGRRCHRLHLRRRRRDGRRGRSSRRDRSRCVSQPLRSSFTGETMCRRYVEAYASLRQRRLPVLAACEHRRDDAVDGQAGVAASSRSRRASFHVRRRCAASSNSTSVAANAARTAVVTACRNGSASAGLKSPCSTAGDVGDPDPLVGEQLQHGCPLEAFPRERRPRLGDASPRVDVVAEQARARRATRRSRWSDEPESISTIVLGEVERRPRRAGRHGSDPHRHQIAVDASTNGRVHSTDAVRIEEALDRIGAERLGQVEALPALAAEPLEQLQLVGVLDALGDRPQPQGPAHPQHRVHQHGAIGMRVDAVDEALVDLQHVDRELLQVRQRRVPRAEVVERDADPELLELVQARDRLRVGHHGLGHLEHQRRGWDAGRAQGAADLVDELVVLELVRRDVDTHQQIGRVPGGGARWRDGGMPSRGPACRAA